MLCLLLGERSLVLNRAAMSAPELAAALIRLGRQATGTLVEHYLTGPLERGELPARDLAEAFHIFHGLLVRDSQIRALLGDPSIAHIAVEDRAAVAARQFLALPNTRKMELTND